MTIKARSSLVSVPFDVFYCDTIAKARKIQQSILGSPVDFEEVEGADAFIYFTNGPGFCYAIVYMAVDTARPLALSHAVLAHEAMHAWRYIREFIGEESPSKEFEAYAMQSICEKLFTAHDKAYSKAQKKTA